jgi:DNA polymerase
MESNKTSEEFFFYEAALVKKTEPFGSCTNIVVGKGNVGADILFVGEAPGRNEDLEGLPFVGAAGKNLDKLLEDVGLSLDDVHVANILKCRPPENRDPLPDEIRAHTPWLLKQIREMKPKVVCSLGNYATKFFLALGDVDKMEGQPGIMQVHGVVRDIEIDGLRIRLIPLFHPAAIIYNRTKLTPLWEADMEVVKKEISGGGEGSGENNVVKVENDQKVLF